MISARDRILARIRFSLGPRDPISVVDRLSQPRRNLVPARAASLDPAGRIALFARMAGSADAAVLRVPGVAGVPAALAAYLAGHNLPAELVMAPDPALDAYPWDLVPTLTIRRGRAEDRDLVSVTSCVAGIAETGTLMLASGPDSPTTLNFLPDTHVVVLRADQVVASMEDGIGLLRARGVGHGSLPHGRDWALPRAVNFITGPSRTGDIEQKIQLGVHGPRRLAILLVDPP